jgi:hypothetical protein
MSIFTAHPHEQGLSYFEHWLFAMGIARRLVSSAVAFAVHALLPFVTIKPELDLEATAASLLERNRFVEQSAVRARGWRIDGRDAADTTRRPAMPGHS